MIRLHSILEQVVRGTSQLAGTEDDDRTIVPQEDITKELAKVGADDFRVTTIKGSYAITLERKFDDYKQTLKFVNDVAKISEKLDSRNVELKIEFDFIKSKNSAPFFSLDNSISFFSFELLHEDFQVLL